MNKIYFVFALMATSVSVTGQSFRYNGEVFMDSDRSYIQLGNFVLPPRPNAPVDETTQLTAMEAQISPNYFVRFGKQNKWAMVVTPKVVLRLGDKESFPIKAPSYLPSIALYQRLSGKMLQASPVTSWLITPHHTPFLLYKITHHSNGQKGDFFANNGMRINYSTGNFSTDFVELGFQWVALEQPTDKFLVNGRLSYERHLDALTREEAMENIYYYNRFLLELAFCFTPKIQLTLKPEWMTGKKDFNQRGALTASLEYRPFKSSSDLGFFARFYRGPDYYNIRYFQNQTSYGIGIKARPLQQH